MIRDLTYYLRSGGNSVVVVASATAGGNSICVAQLPPDIRCQWSLRLFKNILTSRYIICSLYQANLPVNFKQSVHNFLANCPVFHELHHHCLISMEIIKTIYTLKLLALTTWNRPEPIMPA